MFGHSEPKMKDVPIGLDAGGATAREFDTMGDGPGPGRPLLGSANPAVSLVHFSIGNDKMPKEVYHAYGTVKKACALVNAAEGRLAAVEGRCHRAGGRRDDRRPAR